MKKRQILKALSLLAVVCITAGCNASTAVETTTTAAEITTTTEEETGQTDSNSDLPELEVDYVDDFGVIHYKNPTELSYEQIYEGLKINGIEYKAPLTLKKLGNNFYIMEDTISYLDGESGLCAQLAYNDKPFSVVTIKDCLESDEREDKEIIMMVISTAFSEENNVLINDVGMGSTREDIIAAFGVPCTESFSEQGDSATITYGTDNSMLSFSYENNSVMTIIIGFEV